MATWNPVDDVPYHGIMDPWMVHVYLRRHATHYDTYKGLYERFGGDSSQLDESGTTGFTEVSDALSAYYTHLGGGGFDLKHGWQVTPAPVDLPQQLWYLTNAQIAAIGDETSRLYARVAQSYCAWLVWQMYLTEAAVMLHDASTFHSRGRK